MKLDRTLKLLYKFNQPSEESDLGGYSIIMIFSDYGRIPLSEIEKVYMKTFGDLDEVIIFKTFDQLQSFAFNFMDSLDSPEIYLLSVQDYNIGVESVRDLRAYRELFRRFGEEIINTELIGRQKGLLSRLFK